MDGVTDRGKETMTDQHEPREVCCALCGARCLHNPRIGLRLLGLLVAWVGWLVFPLLGMSFRDDVGLVVGGGVWLVVLLICFQIKPAWVCCHCGAAYPTEKRPAARGENVHEETNE